MSLVSDPTAVVKLLRWVPIAIFGMLVSFFATQSSQFLTIANFGAVLMQSSWLIAVATGANLVLLTAGVDLSVGSAMYVAAVTICLLLSHTPVGLCMAVSLAVGAIFGMINASLIALLGLPAFIVTLAMLFIGRSTGLFFTSTRIIHASPPLAEFGRATFVSIPIPLWLASVAVGVSLLILNRTPFGLYVRSIGADAEGARRVGVPTRMVTFGVYILCGAFAGLGGFISLSQTSAASGAFGQNAEFLAIAAAVLGGTSLFGGRGNAWSPVIGAILISTVQNGLVLIDANPYAYPVITGSVIFIAALLDSGRLTLQARLERRRTRPESSSPATEIHPLPTRNHR
jgi:ribose transport system permease protein